MNRLYEQHGDEAYGVPHACGDEPDAADFVEGLVKCSPRLWG